MILQELTNWELCGYWPNAPLQSNTMETGVGILPVTPWIKATVPGDVHNDLLNASLIEDPYYELNSLKTEWVANRCWVYRTKFNPGEPTHQQLFVVFKGIDYKAHIFLNDEKIGEHIGMYTPCRIDITRQCCYNEENELRVIIEEAPAEMGQIGYTSKTSTQKSRFGYKWDFATRLVSLGLYDSVIIEAVNDTRIEETYISYRDGTVTARALICSQNNQSSDLEAILSFEGKEISRAKISLGGSGWGEISFKVEDPALWWPNGYGSQPLYRLELLSSVEGVLSDSRVHHVGLRTLSYHKCEDAPEDSLPYIIAVNGVKIPMKGVNITPLDHMYGAVTEERYEKIVRLAKEGNVNLIRVWGGGLIEKEIFYDLCDRYGILVWQDFIQSSSSIDNMPSEDPAFLELLSRVANAAVREKRNHASLAVWCGGNELMNTEKKPVSFDHKNIAMLKEIVEKHDPQRLFLPATASGPRNWLEAEEPEKNHDVHGPWVYMGPTEHYRYFNDMEVLLLGECGCDGMNNFDTLQTILSPENQKVFSMKENFVWAHHGQMWDTYTMRDKDIFGETEDLKSYVIISQYIQAEGIRYAIESQLRRFPKTAGLSIWQFNEPWPNVSCTNLVDYYAKPKLAYYFTKDAFSTFCMTAKYDKLVYDREDTFRAEIYLHDEIESEAVTAAVRLLNSDKKCVLEKEEESVTRKGIAKKAFSLELPVDDLGRVFYLECTLKGKERQYKNTYLFFVTDPQNPYADADAVLDFVNGYLSEK